MSASWRKYALAMYQVDGGIGEPNDSALHVYRRYAEAVVHVQESLERIADGLVRQFQLMFDRQQLDAKTIADLQQKFAEAEVKHAVTVLTNDAPKPNVAVYVRQDGVWFKVGKDGTIFIWQETQWSFCGRDLDILGTYTEVII
jgi:hypothetical protein